MQLPKYLIICGLLLSTLISKANNCSSLNPRDTALAQVVYGNEYLFSHIDSLSTKDLIAYRDSLSLLVPIPKEHLAQVQVFIKIRTMEFEEIYETIDSLFDLAEVPYPLINELNRYLSNHQNTLANFESELIDTSDYPADYYYHSWNTITPNPYNTTKLASRDSIIELQLIGTIRSKKFVMPVNDKLTSKFGWRDGRMHKGIDIDLQVWDTVVTAFSGMVRVARTYSGYGRVVVVRHFNGLETLYAHLHRIKVKPGQIVTAGELIGLGGSSGHSTGSHLHWEVRFKGYPINPLNFVDYSTQSLINNTLVLHKTKNGFAGYPKGSVFYVVQNGDYLYKIAANYGTTISKICKLNGINRNSRLSVGQKLRVI
ncbi:MAG: peptidoglycan DD-metalloendopeptidase family protein [Salibacteraceae bacterium]